MLSTSTVMELACKTIIRVSSLTITSMDTAPWNQSRLGSTLRCSAYDSGTTDLGSRMFVHGSGDPSSATVLSTRPEPGRSVGSDVAGSSAAPHVGRRLSRTAAAMSRAARTPERTTRPTTVAVKRLQRHGRHRRLGRPVPVATVVDIDSSISSRSGPLITASSLTFTTDLSTLGRSVIRAVVRHEFISHNQTIVDSYCTITVVNHTLIV